MKSGWVYIMTNAPFGTLYVGVTSNLAARVHQHREGKGSAFCRRYGLTRLVYAEQHERIEEAIAREKAMKAWQRKWKTTLIEKHNPRWTDLFGTLNG
jgi:putative endonuclease